MKISRIGENAVNQVRILLLLGLRFDFRSTEFDLD